MTTTTTPQPPTGGAASPSPSRRRRLRLALIALVVLIVLALILLLAAPTLLSTGVGRGIVTDQINSRIGGKASIGGLSLSWFGGQRIDSFELKDPQGGTVVNVHRIDLPGASLWGLVRGNLDLGAVAIDKPVVNLVQHADGSTNLQQALVKPGADAPPPSGQPTAIPAGLKLKLTIQEGHVSLAGARGEPLVLSGLKLDGDLTNWSRLTATLASKTALGAQTGSIDVNATVIDLFDAQGVMDVAKVKVEKTTVNVMNVPVGALDALPIGAEAAAKLATLREKLLALLGDKATVKITATGDAKSNDMTIELSTPRVQGVIPLALRESGIELREPASIRATVGKDAWPRLTGGGGAAAGELRKDFTLALDITALTLPRKDDRYDIASAGVTLAASLTDVEIAAPAPVGSVALRGTRLSLATKALAQSATVTLTAIGEQNGQSGPVDLKVTVEQLLTRDGGLNARGMKLAIAGGVKQFPVALADQFVKLPVALAAAVGPMLDAKLIGQFQPGEDGKSLTGEFSLSANADNLDAELSAALAPSGLTVNKGGHIHARVTQGVIDSFMGHRSGAAATIPQLVGAPWVKLDVERIVAPMSGGALNLPSIEVVVNGRTDPVTLRDASMGDVNLTDVSLSLTASPLRDGATLSVGAHSENKGDKGQFAISAQARNLFNKDGKPDAALATGDAKITLTKFSTAMADAFVQPRGLLATAIGASVNAVITAAYVPDTGKGWAVNYGVESLKADQIELLKPIQGVYTPSLLKQTAGGQVRYVVARELLPLLMTKPGAPAPAGVGLKEPATIELTLGAVELPLPAKGQRLDLSKLNLGLSGTIDQLVPAPAPGVPEGASLKGITFNLSQGRLSEPIKFKLAGKVSDPAQPGDIAVDATVTDALNATRKIDATVTGTSLPVALIDAVLAGGGKYVALLGDRINTLNAKVATDPTGVIVLERGNIESAHLKANLKARFKAEELLSVGADSTVDLNVTPRAFELWTAPAPAGDGKPARPTIRLALREPMPLKIAFKQAEIGLAAASKGKPAPTGLGMLELQRTKLNIHLASPGVVLQAGDAKPAQLHNLAASIIGEDLTRSLRLSVTSDAPPTPRGEPIKLDVPLDVRGLAIKDGALDTGKLNVVISELKDAKRPLRVTVPAALLESLAALAMQAQGSPPLEPGLVQGILCEDQNGMPRADSSVALAVWGAYNMDPAGKSDLALDLKSGNVTLAAAPSINAGNMTLREDLKTQLAITPTLSRAVLKPLTSFLDPRSGERPVSVVVKKDGFSMPVKDFSITRLAASAVIDPGTVAMGEDSVLGKVSTLFHPIFQLSKGLKPENALGLVEAGIGLFDKPDKKDRKPADTQAAQNLVLASFAPFDLNLTGGKASYKNIALKLTSLDVPLNIRFSGDVDLANQTKSLTMTVTGEPLAKIPGLDKVFSADKGLDIPLSGGVGDSKSDGDAIGGAVKSLMGSVLGLGGKGGAGGLVEGVMGGLGGKKESAKDDKAEKREKPDAKPSDKPAAPPSPAAPAPTPAPTPSPAPTATPAPSPAPAAPKPADKPSGAAAPPSGGMSDKAAAPADKAAPATEKPAAEPGLGGLLGDLIKPDKADDKKPKAKETPKDEPKTKEKSKDEPKAKEKPKDEPKAKPEGKRDSAPGATTAPAAGAQTQPARATDEKSDKKKRPTNADRPGQTLNPRE